MKTIVKPAAGSKGRIITPAQARQARQAAAAMIVGGGRRFGTVKVPEFANVIDRTDPILGVDPDRGYKDGQVFFANDSRFTETYYSEPLTTYTVGWRDPNNIEETLQFFAPAVQVGRRFEWKAAANAEEFLSEVVDDQRAIGADFKAVKYTATDVTDKTLNRGLTIIVDLDNVPGGMGAGTGVPGWQQQRVAKLTRRLYRNSLRRAITAIAAAAVSTPYTWSAQAAAPGVQPVNPDLDVANELIAATNITGIRPNRVAYGDTSFLYRQQAYGAQNNPAGYMGYAAGGNAEAALAAALQVDKVKISRERYQSGANAKTEILGANVYAFFANDDVDTEDASNVKRFVSMFDAEQGGGLFRVYVQQISSKLVAITVEFYEKIVITYSGGIRQLAVVNA
jgi:hypothetical protein